MASAAASSTRTLPKGAKRVTDLLQKLKAKPQLTLSGLKSLRLSYAFRNDHFGARHFVKDDLPRIRYANPNLDIRIEPVTKLPGQSWKPEMEIEFADGQKKTLSMCSKWSSTILEELMSVAGGSEWKQHVESCKAQGLPIVPPPPAGTPKHFKSEVESEKLMSFSAFKEKYPGQFKPKEKTTPNPKQPATA